jgi:hypothetical protein
MFIIANFGNHFLAIRLDLDVPTAVPNSDAKNAGLLKPYDVSGLPKNSKVVSPRSRKFLGPYERTEVLYLQQRQKYLNSEPRERPPQLKVRLHFWSLGRNLLQLLGIYCNSATELK